MSQTWALIIGLTLATFAIKAAGPVALGGRALPGWFNSLIVVTAPALLAALVVTTALADGEDLGVGADTAGVAVAGIIFLRKGPLIVGVVAAAAVTALLRAL